MNPFFNWLKDSGTQAMLVLVGTVSAIVAAAAAIFFGMKSLTKADLKELEDHASATSAHLATQSKREELDTAASIVSIKIHARDFQDEPLQVHLTVQDETVSLKYIEMLDGVGTRYGGGECVMYEEPDQYIAELECQRVANWYNAGERKGNASHLWLRIVMCFRERPGEGRKRMPVVLLPAKVGTERKTGPVWELSGEV